MKSFRKILYLFLIIFTLSFSIDGEKSKVVLDKRYDTAKLKIGVTKLISKELPLEFHAESKKIYGEIDIDENDLVFVSETLDEMPSVSTTNGRKAINNIKKYLIKEIKKSPKFEYQIVEGKSESDKKEGKRYLLIDCKEQISSVYIYVVEKGSYKVKEVYRGVFRQLFKAQARNTSYGTIHFNSNHLLSSRILRVGYNGSSILVGNKPVNYALIEDIGGFPKKSKRGKLTKPFREFEGYRIKVKNLKGSMEAVFPKESYSEFEKSENKTDNLINRVVNLYGTLSDGTTQSEEIAGELRIKSNNTDEYLNFEIRLNYSMIDIENEITIEYGNSPWSTFYPLYSDTFKIKIDKKEISELPENTNGILTILKGEQLYKTVTTITGKDDVTAESSGAEIEFEGKYLKVLDTKMEVGQKVLKIIVQNRNRLKEEEKTIVINDGEGKVLNTYGGEFNLYDSFGVGAGKIHISKAGVDDKYYTIKISEFPKVTEMVNTNIILQYIARPVGNTGEEDDKVVKEDFVTLYVNPIDQNIPKGVHGKLVLYTTENLRNNDFFIENGQIRTEESGGTTAGDYTAYNLSKCRYSNFPMRFKNNNSENVNDKNINWIYWGNDAQIVIDGPNYHAEIPFENRDDGSFITHNKVGEDGWIRMQDTTGKNIQGFIQFNMGSDKESLKIGFRGSVLNDGDEEAWGHFVLEGGQAVDSVYHIKYQAKLKNKSNNGTVTDVWHTIKEDIIEIIIDSSIKENEKIIDLSNPLVYYDYESSSAISNIVHNKRAHLSGKEARTLTSGGATFSKNTDLSGKKWIELTGEDVLDYSKSFNRKHKVTIRQGSSEVVKMTDENGRTSSSTFLGDTKTITSNSRDGRGNEVMFSYDGGNKYLNFGLSKYNFEGTTISDVSITNGGIIDNDGGSVTDTTTSREYFTIKIPRFEGIHYVNQNYDIKPEQDYVKDHEFDQNKGNKPITIEYGTVGFRDLDIRITKQNDSGLKAEGIEIRAYKDVILKNDAGYTIKGAKLYFAPGQNVGNDGDKITYFKGENEKATYNMLMLDIPNQETLIPKDRFRILRADTEGYPLEVGVTVNGDTTKYYTPIDNEGRENKAAGKNLYLNLSTRRLVKTTIEFENPDLSVKDENGQDAKEINWIRLNKTNFSGGKLTTPINNSDLWGRVRGEVIDIPVEWQGKKFENLKLQVFQEKADGKEDQITSDLTGKQISFAVPQETGKSFVMKYAGGTNHIEFSLDKGYKDNIVHDNIVFYIRYMDGDKFLFDQEYTVKFNKRVDYLGDTTLIIKNPAMVSGANNKGKIILRNSGETLGENNNSTFDSIKWFEVQNPINYKLKYPDIKEWTVTKIDGGTRYIDYKILDTGEIEIGIPDIENEFKEFFNLADYKGGKEIEQSFTVSGTDNSKNKKSYRLNIIIEKFDPRYYGKVYPVGNLESANENYNEINETGIGSFDLIKFSGDEFVYIDLGTNYRDYSRYMNILEALGNGSIKIGVKNDSDVEVTAKDNGSAPIVKGKVVFKKGNDYLSEKIISAIDSAGSSQNDVACPEDYSLYLKLTQKEYRKLKPYTTYEIFLNGNQNVFTFQVDGNSTLDKEMIFKKPLSFKTTGPSITIIPEILDFGQIKPKEHSEPLITKSAQAGIKVIIEDDLAKEFTTVLEPETEEIWIYEKSGTGVTKENGEKLKVRSITVTNKTQNGVTADGKQRQDDFIISGVLEVPNKTEPKRAEYGGYVTVNFTYY